MNIPTRPTEERENFAPSQPYADRSPDAHDRTGQSALKPLDYLVFGVVALVAVALAALRICPVDWLWACATILVVAFWAFCIYRKGSTRR